MTDLKKMSEQFQADELPTKADIDKLDKLRFRDFLRGVYKQEYPDTPAELTRLLQNMNLATEGGNLNLAGVLLFVDQPEFIVPQFVVKAIRYPGNEIHATDYVDTEDFSGNLRRIFDNALGFVMRNLHKVRVGHGVNTPGLHEVPETVFDELLVNALAHRDYLISAPYLVRILDTGGESEAAKLVAKLGGKAESARELAYRHYSVCERRKRAAEALAYNSLVLACPELTRLAQVSPRLRQMELFS